MAIRPLLIVLLAASASAFLTTPGNVLRLSTSNQVSATRRPAAALGLRMTASEAAATGTDANVKATFTQEMRAKAMSLHTFSQAPKQGQQRDSSANTVVDQWLTTKEDFLQFLVDNKVVYQAFEKAVEMPHLSRFQNTGLERVKPLEQDIAWFESEFGLKAPMHTKDATDYADFLLDLAKNKQEVWVCHFYNYYFAHTAGGRMIFKRISDDILDGRSIKFYEWDGDVKDILTEVKTRIDAQAEGWTREQKDASLDATMETFQKSGLLLRALVGKARDRAARMSSGVQVRGGKIVGVGPSAYSKFKKPWDV